MLKIIGIVLTIGAFCTIGFSASDRLRRRIESLLQLISCLEILRSEISFRLTPLPDIMSLLAKQAVPPLQYIFEDLSEKKPNNLSFAIAWNDTFARYVGSTGFLPEDLAALRDLSTVLGRYEASEQVKGIGLATRRLEQNLKAAKDEQTRKGKTYKALGFTIGVVVVLIFI